jgi:hypothetical protein
MALLREVSQEVNHSETSCRRETNTRLARGGISSDNESTYDESLWLVAKDIPIAGLVHQVGRDDTKD